MQIFIVQGWRNLWRNLRRTIITMAVVAVGLMLMIVSYGLMEGFVPQMIEGGARTLNGHLLIQAEGYFRKKSLDLLIKQPQHIEQLLRKDPRVESWSKRVINRGLLGSAEGMQGVKLLGVDPAEDQKIITLYSKIIEGRAPRLVPPKTRASRHTIEVLLGRKIAEKLKVGVGSKVVLRVGTLGEGATSVALRVSGIFALGAPGMDSFYIVLHRKEAARLLQVQGKVHQFAVRVKALEDVGPVVTSLRKKLSSSPTPLEILPWWKTAPEIKAMVNMSEISIGIMLLFIFPIVLLGCLNTMLMSAFERSREIGIMKALGTRPSQIISLFFWEAAFIGLIGASIGVALGVGTNLWLEQIGGLSLRPFMSDDVKMLVSGVALDPVMWVRTTAAVVLLPTISVLLSTILAALYPAWKVSRLKPAQAILFT